MNYDELAGQFRHYLTRPAPPTGAEQRALALDILETAAGLGELRIDWVDHAYRIVLLVGSTGNGGVCFANSGQTLSEAAFALCRNLSQGSRT